MRKSKRKELIKLVIL